jgi:hypothetical protein
VNRNLAPDGMLVLRIDARTCTFQIEARGYSTKTFAIKGLYNMFLNFQGYLELMRREAMAEWKLTQRKPCARLVPTSES